jgi:hypothetical protein
MARGHAEGEELLMEEPTPDFLSEGVPVSGDSVLLVLPFPEISEDLNEYIPSADIEAAYSEYMNTSSGSNYLSTPKLPAERLPADFGTGVSMEDMTKAMPTDLDQIHTSLDGIVQDIVGGASDNPDQYATYKKTAEYELVTRHDPNLPGSSDTC